MERGRFSFVFVKIHIKDLSHNKIKLELTVLFDHSLSRFPCALFVFIRCFFGRELRESADVGGFGVGQYGRTIRK